MISSAVHAAFFSILLSLYHGLHCLYVSKDPGYKGKLGIGFPWAHQGIAYLNESPWWKNYGLQSTLTVLVSGFFISLVAFNSLSLSEGASLHGFVFPILALVGISVFSQIMAPGGYKGFLSLFLIAQIIMLYYLTSGDVQTWVLPYISAVGPVSFTIGFGWMQIMLSKFTKDQRRQSLYVMGLYAIGSLLFTWIGWSVLLLRMLL